ncbi:MAG: von Willebrand factor type A domain-containing protein [Pirellulaceae bacterium]
MNEETRKLPIEPELEARIVALVLGEASDFETVELNRLIKARPELAAFKLEMEQVSKLLREVGPNELETPNADWQLSSERRQVVLDVIHGKVTAPTIGKGEEVFSQTPRLQRQRWMQVLQIAAVASILFVLIGLMLPGVQMTQEAARRLTRAEVSNSPKSMDSKLAPTSEARSFGKTKELANSDSTDPKFSFYMNFDRSQAETPVADSRQNSAAALSAIQNSLQQSAATASVELGAKGLSTPPVSGLSLGVTPQFTPPQNWSAPGDVNGIDLPSITQSPTLPAADYDRLSGFVPDQADKLIAGFQPQRGASPTETLAMPKGTTLLGGIEEPAVEALRDRRVLDSIEKQKVLASRELSEIQTGEGWFDADDRPGSEGQQLSPRGGLGFQKNQKLENKKAGELKGNEQQGQGLAENRPVAGLDNQVPDPTMAANDYRYRSSTSGLDVPGGYNSDFGISGEISGRGGVIGGSGQGGGIGRSHGLGSQETPRFGTEASDGRPSDGERVAAEFEHGQSAPAEPKSPFKGKFLDQTMEPINESGKMGEAEKKLAESGGKTDRSMELEPRKNFGDETTESSEKEYLKPKSAELTLNRLSERHREIEFELTRGGQTEPNERVTELDKEVEGLAGEGIDRTKDQSREQSGKYSKGAKLDEQKTLRRDRPQIGIGGSSGDLLDLTKKSISKREATSAGLNETNAATEGFSTFSLHVSDVSFKLAAAALARGEWPEAAKIRIEEFVNAFDYGDPLPCANEKVACVVEQAIHPFLQQRNVLRVSMRTSAEGRAANTPLRLTLVLDNSGSMERIDRQLAVRQALSLLAQQLSPSDQVTLISFARQPRLLAENVSGTQSGKLVELIAQLPSEGGTNIEAALKLAFEKAVSQRTPGVQNRIVLLTDGAVNLGNANPESLSRMVEGMRTAGIAFDAAGISADGLNDEILEALTRKGDGRYYLLDGEESSGGRFAQQIAGALRPSASNVKVQVEFNPRRVGKYKLLGFEKHILQQEDFRNDAVDAAELAAAEAGVALYQFEAKPDGEGDVGTVSVRFRDLVTGQMIEQRWPIPYEANALRPDQATNSIRLATAAAMLAARLRGDALGETVDLKSLSELIGGLSKQQHFDPRVQELKRMIEQARQLSEK